MNRFVSFSWCYIYMPYAMGLRDETNVICIRLIPGFPGVWNPAYVRQPGKSRHNRYGGCNPLVRGNGTPCCNLRCISDTRTVTIHTGGYMACWGQLMGEVSLLIWRSVHLAWSVSPKVDARGHLESHWVGLRSLFPGVRRGEHWLLDYVPPP